MCGQLDEENRHEMEYPFPRLRKNHTSYCIIYGVIIDFVAKEERKGDKVFDGRGEGEIRANGLENCGFPASSSRV